MVMPIPWHRGYEWAQDKGPHADKDSFAAIEAFGWGLNTPESLQFDAGADFFFADCFFSEIGGDDQ